MAPLAAFVLALRASLGNDFHVPHLDPLDGGTEAECLFVLEAPGPKAVASGFVSRNNPDETAKNFYLLNEAAGLARARTAIWNITPWYVGTGSKIRAVNGDDIRAGLPHLLALIALMPNLRILVLVGSKAARAEKQLRLACPRLRVLKMPHPSPMFVNRRPHHRQVLLGCLREVAGALDG